MLYPGMDNGIIVHGVLEETTPGCYRQIFIRKWEGKNIGYVDNTDLGITYEEKFGLKTGTRFEIDGVVVRVLDGDVPYCDAILVVRDEGLRSRLICARWWVRLRILKPVSRLLWRTAWAWRWLEVDPAEVPHWGQFRPYRWIRRMIQKEEGK